jgi:hypothetical protein
LALRRLDQHTELHLAAAGHLESILLLALADPGSQIALVSRGGCVELIEAWQASYAAKVFSPETMAMYVEGLRKAGLPEE